MPTPEGTSVGAISFLPRGRSNSDGRVVPSGHTSWHQLAGTDVVDGISPIVQL